MMAGAGSPPGWYGWTADKKWSGAAPTPEKADEKPTDWAFNPEDYGFLFLKKNKFSILDRNYDNKAFVWFAEKVEHSFLKSPLGRTTGTKTIAYHIRKVKDKYQINKYRIKIALTKKPSDPYGNDQHYEGVWDCVVTSGAKFVQILAELLEEVQEQ